MPSIIQRALKSYQEDGLSHVLRRGYSIFVVSKIRKLYNKHIRTSLPASDEYPTYNGVTIGADKHKHHIFDDIVPIDVPSTSDRPQYEEPLVDAVQSCVQPGDDVVIIGGGYGVTTVAAAKKTRDTGTVTVYEAINERVDIIKSTVQIQDVDGRCNIIHGIVGPAINPGGGLPDGGTTNSADHLSPRDIPPCDVLELDCEGAELEILRGLAIRPHSIVVETHGHRGAAECDVRAELQELGYSIVQRSIEVEENGVFVLTATRSETTKQHKP